MRDIIERNQLDKAVEGKPCKIAMDTTNICKGIKKHIIIEFELSN